MGVSKHTFIDWFCTFPGQIFSGDNGWEASDFPRMSWAMTETSPLGFWADGQILGSLPFDAQTAQQVTGRPCPTSLIITHYFMAFFHENDTFLQNMSLWASQHYHLNHLCCHLPRQKKRQQNPFSKVISCQDQTRMQRPEHLVEGCILQLPGAKVDPYWISERLNLLWEAVMRIPGDSILLNGAFPSDPWEVHWQHSVGSLEGIDHWNFQP